MSFSWPYECEVLLRNLYTAADVHNVLTNQSERKKIIKKTHVDTTQTKYIWLDKLKWRWEFTVTRFNTKLKDIPSCTKRSILFKNVTKKIRNSYKGNIWVFNRNA